MPVTGDAVHREWTLSSLLSYWGTEQLFTLSKVPRVPDPFPSIAFYQVSGKLYPYSEEF